MKKYLALSENEIQALPYSRQYKHMILLMKEGKCCKCGSANTNGKTSCDPCLEKISGSKHRRHTAPEWDTVDFSLPHDVIAEKLGVTVGAVIDQAEKRKIKTYGSRRHMWKQVDWKMTAREISEKFKITTAAVYEHARNNGIKLTKHYRRNETIQKPLEEVTATGQGRETGDGIIYH